MKSTPLVSICCTVYNHEHFVQDTIEGFLMQEVDFPIEILIHDDASTDGSPDILRDYERRYPGLVHVIYQTENQYSKGVRPFVHILFPQARGKYIAMCEGDDHWTDPRKLSRQVAYLEANPDCVLTCGGYEIVSGNLRQRVVAREGEQPNGPADRGFSFALSDMVRDWLTKTLTVVFRTNVQVGDELKGYEYLRDTHLFYHLMKKGRGYYFQDVMGVYNAHEGGVHSLVGRGVRKQSAYRVYRELHLRNRDPFTRIKAFNATVGLIAHEVNDPGTRVDWKRHMRLIWEALLLVRSPSEFRKLCSAVIHRDWKDRLRRSQKGTSVSLS